MCPECICSWVLIDTFDWYPWSTSRRLNQYLVDTTLLTLDQHSTDSQPRVNRHMNQLKIWLTLNWDVDGVSIEHWWSRVSIETQPWMPLVRTIMIQNNWLLYCGHQETGYKVRISRGLGQLHPSSWGKWTTESRFSPVQVLFYLSLENRLTTHDFSSKTLFKAQPAA